MDPRLNFIFKRRSIRKFTAEKITDADLKSLLEAGMAAPSAGGKDPVRFIIMTQPELKQTIAEFLPNGKFLTEAPLGILVLGDIDVAIANSESYMLQDCAASIENILLAATALELGTCWLGVHPREDRIAGIKQFFKLPENLIPISIIAAGHPDETKEPRTRYNPAAVKFNTWN
ncbi:MAG: nitroreductase family protein [Victivallaceae bacterium]|nr:nitroreductase family protein [Victivallaceae bacterium]